MGGDGPDVAPVPVEVERTCRGRRAAGVEQPLGDGEGQPLRDQLCFGDHHGNPCQFVGIVVAPAVDQCVDRVGGVEHQRLRRRRRRRDLPEGVQGERVTGGGVGQRVRGWSGFGPYVPDRVVARGGGDPGGHGGEIQLQERGAVAQVLSVGDGGHFMGQHLDVGEAGAAAGGGALPETVPVVEQFHPRPVGRHDRLQIAPFGVGRGDGDQVGEQRPGRVELVAVEPQHPPAVGEQGGVRSGRCLAFGVGDRVADDDSGVDAGEPLLALRFDGAVAQQPFGEAEVRPKRLGHIGTAPGDPDHRGQHLAHRTARAAVADRHPQGEHTGLTDGGDGVVLEYPVPFGGGVSLTQRIDDGRQPGEALGGRSAQGLSAERWPRVNPARSIRCRSHCRT